MNKLFNFFRVTNIGKLLIIIGIICIVFGIFFFMGYQNNKNYVEIEGKIFKTKLVHDSYTDSDGNYVEASYDIYVRYTVDGKKYEAVLNNMSGFKEGDSITISYNPKNPEQISQSISIFLPIFLLVSGIGSFIGGIITLVSAGNKHKVLKNQNEMFVTSK